MAVSAQAAHDLETQSADDIARWRAAGDEGRPLTRAERKRLELRQEIIDTAFDCFAEKGYYATGIADIANRLGIGQGTFYRFFDSKREIVDHLIDSALARIRAALDEASTAERPATQAAYREQTDRIAHAFITTMLDDPRVARVLLLDAGIDTQMTDRLLDVLDSAAGLTGHQLQRGVDAGHVRADLDVDRTARAINGMLVAGLLHSLRHGDRSEAREYAAAFRRLVFDGISATNGAGG